MVIDPVGVPEHLFCLVTNISGYTTNNIKN